MLKSWFVFKQHNTTTPQTTNKKVSQGKIAKFCGLDKKWKHAFLKGPMTFTRFDRFDKWQMLQLTKYQPICEFYKYKIANLIKGGLSSAIHWYSKIWWGCTKFVTLCTVWIGTASVLEVFEADPAILKRLHWDQGLRNIWVFLQKNYKTQIKIRSKPSSVVTRLFS